MNTTRLDKLVAFKTKKDLSNSDQADLIASVRAEVLLDISKRYPWSFLSRSSEDISISSGDSKKLLPQDFMRVIGVALLDSDNVVYPVHSERPGTFEEENPDEDDTDCPYRYWLEWNQYGKVHIVLKPKADAGYTLRLRYQKLLLATQVSLVPDGLVPFYGMAAILEDDPEKMAYYDSRYEKGIAKMWACDMPDLNDTPDLKEDKAIETFNTYMDSLL